MLYSTYLRKSISRQGAYYSKPTAETCSYMEAQLVFKVIRYG